MAHRLNTNKQFMVGNGILAFAVIFVVVIFCLYEHAATTGKAGRTSFHRKLYDQSGKRFCRRFYLFICQRQSDLQQNHVGRTLHCRNRTFCEQSALLIVDNNTELVSTFDLSEKGGTYQFEKESDNTRSSVK